MPYQVACLVSFVPPTVVSQSGTLSLAFLLKGHTITERQVDGFFYLIKSSKGDNSCQFLNIAFSNDATLAILFIAVPLGEQPKKSYGTTLVLSCPVASSMRVTAGTRAGTLSGMQASVSGLLFGDPSKTPNRQAEQIIKFEYLLVSLVVLAFLTERQLSQVQLSHIVPLTN